MAKRETWPEQLREQGRSMTWLAEQVGVSRQYLSAVASGARNGSPALLAAIRRELAERDTRLDQAEAYAARRSVFLDIRAAVAGTLMGQPELQLVADQRIEELAEDVTRACMVALARITQELTEA